MIKKGLLLLSAIFIAVLLIACRTGEPEELYVEIEVKPIIHDNGFVSFEVVTNLPDNTNLTLILQRVGRGTDPQTTVTVQNGTATSAQMSDQQQPVVGKRTLVVSMSSPYLQERSVLRIIGTDGERLVGPLVETTEQGYNVVRAEFDIDFDDFLDEVYVIEFMGLEFKFPHEVIFSGDGHRNVWVYAAEGDRSIMIAIHYEPIDTGHVDEAALERFIHEATSVYGVSNIHRYNDSGTLFPSEKLSYVRVINEIEFDITMYVIPLGNTGILSTALIEQSEGSIHDLSREFQFMMDRLEIGTYVDREASE